jgi:hypothetical protein
MEPSTETIKQLSRETNDTTIFDLVKNSSRADDHDKHQQDPLSGETSQPPILVGNPNAKGDPFAFRNRPQNREISQENQEMVG